MFPDYDTPEGTGAGATKKEEMETSENTTGSKPVQGEQEKEVEISEQKEEEYPKRVESKEEQEVSTSEEAGQASLGSQAPQTPEMPPSTQNRKEGWWQEWLGDKRERGFSGVELQKDCQAMEQD